MTRKIETEMNAAIQNGKQFTKANTAVYHHEGVAIVRLHGNKIAEIGDDWMTLFDGGYQSTTTKSRLNALLAEFWSRWRARLPESLPVVHSAGRRSGSFLLRDAPQLSQ